MDENTFWLRMNSALLLAAVTAFAAALYAGAVESTKTTALCKQAIEQKADFAIAKLCR